MTKTFEVQRDKNNENIESVRDDGFAFIDELQREKKLQAQAQKRGILKNISDNNRSNNETYRSM